MRNIVLTFSLAFCLAFVSSSARAATQAEIQAAIEAALSPYVDSGGAIFTMPYSEQWEAIGTMLLDSHGSPLGWDFYEYWLSFLRANYGTSYPHSDDPSYLALMLALLQSQVAHSTNFYSRAGNVLFPSGQPNLYQVENASLNSLLATSDDVDSIRRIDDAIYSILNQSGLSNYGQWLSQINQHLSNIRTESGAYNLNGPAFEVNDSATHLSLETIIDKIDAVIAAIPTGGSDSSADISDIKQSVLDLRDTLLDLSGEFGNYQRVQKDRFDLVLRQNARQASMEWPGIQVFDPLVNHSITNLYRNERNSGGLPTVLKDGIQVFDPYAKLGYQYNTNFWKGFVQNLVVGTGTNRAIRVVPGGLLASNLQSIASFYQPEDRIALDTNSVAVVSGTNTNLVDNSAEEKALQDKSDESIEDFEKQAEDQQEEAQDAVEELVSTVDESFDEIKEKLDPGQHEERLIDGLAPSTDGGSSKLLIWNAWEHSGIHVPKLEIDFGDKRLENFRKRANLILRSCYWLAFCLTAINLLRSLAIYLFSLGHVNEVAANALDAVGVGVWQPASPEEFGRSLDFMSGGAINDSMDQERFKSALRRKGDL